MPYPITKGLGSQGDGTSSGLVTTQGYGDPGLAAPGFPFTLLLAEIYEDRLELVFSVPVQVAGPAAVGSGWTITTLVNGAPIPVVGSVQVVGTRIKLSTTEARTGVLYTLNFPVVGLTDTSNNLFAGPFTYAFLGNGIEPFVSLAGAEDGYHVKVIFSEPVVAADALVAANYIITGGAGLTVFEVEQETAQSFILRTSLQTVNQTYTVTVSNIKDLQGNLI